MATEHDALSDAWNRLLDQAVQAALSNASQPQAAARLDKVASLFGTTLSELQADPAKGREVVNATLGQVSTMIQDAVSLDPSRREAATGRLTAAVSAIEQWSLPEGAEAGQPWERLREAVAQAPEALSQLLKSSLTPAAAKQQEDPPTEP